MTQGSDLIITVGMRSKSNLPGGTSFSTDATSENISLQLRLVFRMQMRFFGSFFLIVIAFSSV